MLSRSGGPRGRKPQSGLQATGRPVACLAVAATLLVTWISLSQLSHLISPDEKVSAGEVIRASDWHSVIDGTERNIESHLPRWRGVDTQLLSTRPAPGALPSPAAESAARDQICGTNTVRLFHRHSRSHQAAAKGHRDCETEEGWRSKPPCSSAMQHRSAHRVSLAVLPLSACCCVPISCVVLVKH